MIKIVVNGTFGGFGMNVNKKYSDFVEQFRYNRTAPELIDFVENHSNDCGSLGIVEIPECATDWELNEYDGVESIIYVVDGKIHHSSIDDDYDDWSDEDDYDYGLELFEQGII